MLECLAEAVGQAWRVVLPPVAVVLSLAIPAPVVAQCNGCEPIYNEGLDAGTGRYCFGTSVPSGHALRNSVDIAQANWDASYGSNWFTEQSSNCFSIIFSDAAPTNGAEWCRDPGVCPGYPQGVLRVHNSLQTQDESTLGPLMAHELGHTLGYGDEYEPMCEQYNVMYWITGGFWGPSEDDLCWIDGGGGGGGGGEPVRFGPGFGIAEPVRGLGRPRGGGGGGGPFAKHRRT